MARIISFPVERCVPTIDDYRAEPAIVLILPVVRIERRPDYNKLTSQIVSAAALLSPHAERRVCRALDRLRSSLPESFDET